jgi:branched-chain amino acid transport system substrate-binding protein
MAKRSTLGIFCALALGGATALAQQSSVFTIGTLYAGSGSFATSSLPQYQGLKFWAQQVNAKGGVYVKSLGKRLKIKIVALNDQSSTSTAETEYNQLITQDHVNLLVADFGSVLTSVAIPLANEHHVLLIDPTGTGASFFPKPNPYLVLAALPTSAVWPDSLANFLIARKLKRVAILYDTNDFDQSQAQTLAQKLKAAGITPVYDNGVSTSTSNYTVLVHDIAATNPQVVAEFGYSANDIPFLQAVDSSGLKFNLVFTVFPGQLEQLLQKNVGTAGLNGTLTYPTPPLLAYNKVNFGLGVNAFTRAFKAAGMGAPNFLDIAGYNSGLVIQRALQLTSGLKPLALRRAIQSFSGKMFTLDGLFKVQSSGAQVGELLPVAQFQMQGGQLKLVIVYPKNVATGKLLYPAP